MHPIFHDFGGTPIFRGLVSDVVAGHLLIL